MQYAVFVDTILPPAERTRLSGLVIRLGGHVVDMPTVATHIVTTRHGTKSYGNEHGFLSALVISDWLVHSADAGRWLHIGDYLCTPNFHRMLSAGGWDVHTGIMSNMYTRGAGIGWVCDDDTRCHGVFTASPELAHRAHAQSVRRAAVAVQSLARGSRARNLAALKRCIVAHLARGTMVITDEGRVRLARDVEYGRKSKRRRVCTTV